jgi:hypothetical protein
MSNKQSSQKNPYMEMSSNSSPWTELFQQEQPATTSAPSHTSGHQSEHAQSARSSENDTTRPTRDALSAIFNFN